ncbi:MAG: hypothetical protein II453_09960 [Alphaproteobacteria bacterium]|nr:hypothetical protein [Alphaproteobacteria bacterium]MBQ3946355.1 hypothetical protein [Alphaproteobacteria bacterium]
MFGKLNFKQNRTLTGMPNMANTLNGWETTITLVKVIQNIVEGDRVISETNITFQGVIQPLRTEQLMAKPENMRSWEWLWIHVKSGSLNLMTGDKIRFNNKLYKVMGVKDYSLNGFVEYEIVRDYENAN